MLVCPQCQFENPDTNKFCQQCGSSVTHKACPECGTQVAYSAKNCQNCGTFTGMVWLAVISAQADRPTSSLTSKTGEEEGLNPPLSESSVLVSPTNQDPVIKNTPNLSSPSAAGSETTASQENSSEIQVNWDNNLSEVDPSQSASDSPQETYLDADHRYQLLEPITIQETGEAQVRVLDCQPLQASPLETLVDQQTKAEANLEAEPEIETSGEELASMPNSVWQSVPVMGKIYLALESDSYPALPRIHDAWINNSQEIILLEDRSDWPVLTDLWRNEEIPLIHLLQLLHEMTTLWVALEPYNCCHSLLELNNLRVDEDQSLGLLRLSKNSPNLPVPTLQDLGQIWQQLFFESGRTLFGPIAMLMSDLKADTIQSIEQLRSRLQAIAQEFQVDTIESAHNMLPVEPDLNLSSASPNLRMPIGKEYQAAYAGTHGDDNEMPTVVLPMQLLSLEDAGRTDVGRQRRHNEDYFGVQTALTKIETPLGRNIQARGLYILCDGMGGHAGGEVASALAVKTLSQYFQAHWENELPDEDCIRQGVLAANQAIYDVNQQDARSGSGRMGTTLVMLLVQETQVAVVHVGDSRLYKVNRRGIEQITVDHEVGQREIKRGVEKAIAYSRPDAYQLTQALGPRNEHFVDPDIKFIELNEDTLLLLCSDGLCDNDLIENNWQTHLQPLLSSRANLEQGVNELIELANQYNGHDNITAVLVRAKVRPDLEQARAGN